MSSGLFGLISKSNQYQAERQTAIAQNVANANTPGYQSVDLAPFERTFDQLSIQVPRRHQAHLALDQGVGSASEVRPVEGLMPNHSGNTVNLEQEMLKAGEVVGNYALGTSVYKAFHRMLLSSAR